MSPVHRPLGRVACFSFVALALSVTLGAQSGGGGLLGERFSLDPASPEIAVAGQSAAHAFVGGCFALACIPPVPYFTPAQVGLAMADDVDGFAPGAAPATTFPPPVGNDLAIHYSITRTSVGIDPVVTGEVAGDGAAGDIFDFRYPAVALQLWDNNTCPPPGTPAGCLGLTGTAAAVESNVDGWAWVAPPGLIQPYFTVDAVTALGLGVSPADVLRRVPPLGDGFFVFAAEAALGLMAGDDIDALSVEFNSGNVWDGNEHIYFSLTPGSPTLIANGWSAADILLAQPGMAVSLWAPAVALGLAPGDDIDALQIFDPGAPVPAFSGWGLGWLVGLTVGVGALVLRRRARGRAGAGTGL